MTLRRTSTAGPAAFTLVELLTVIAIIAVLMSLLFSATGSVRENARRTQAKHDVTQLVAAINAYYVDYGVYPVKPQPAGEATEVTYATDNSDLMNTLRAISQGLNNQNTLNPRQVSYIETPAVRDPAHPRNGISTDGIWYDPWGPQGGKPESGIYHVRIDATYSNLVSDPYPGDAGKDDGDSKGSGSSWKSGIGGGGGMKSGSSGGGDGGSRPGATIPLGVIAWSLAKTGIQTYELQDQVLSWK